MFDLDFPPPEVGQAFDKVGAAGGNGTVVYGIHAETGSNLWQPVVWTTEAGTRPLYEMLEAACVDTTELRQERPEPVALSADGSVFVLCNRSDTEPTCWVGSWK